MTGFKLTISRLLMIGISQYQSTDRRFIHFYLLIYSLEDGLTIGQIQTKLLFNQIHPNGKKKCKKRLAKKIKKYFNFQTITTDNSKHIFRFHTKQYYILYQTSNNNFHQTILFIKYFSIFFNTFTGKQLLHTFPEFITSNTVIFREFLQN